MVAALGRAAGGSGGALLLAGEAGIGKSRLAVEALILARQRGFVTLEGAAYPLQADLAYAPVLEALGPFLAGLEPGRLAALVSGLPDLGRLFAGLHLPPPEPLGDAALERTRLFEAVARLVERVAAQRPVALLIDDLHWADAASLELLHYLARGLEGRRALLLGTYRLDEARTHPRLRVLVRSLERLGLAEELPLGGLGPEAVAALAGALLGGEPPAALLGALRERAAGTPLFVTALIHGLRDTGELFRSGGAWVLGSGSLTAVPPVVRDLVLARLERLDPADRALLELVAVAGDAAFLAILGRVGGPAEGELDAAARRLCESGLVIEEPTGTDLLYRAAHPLIAEVAYGELPETRRRQLHAAVAAALEELRPGDPQRLAHHYRGAAWEADPRRALDVLVAAGQRAEELHADAEAADHFAAALALARTDRPAVVEELLERLGHARSRAGQFEAAVAAWSEAAGGRERSGDRPAAGRLRGLLALAEWDRGRFDAAEAQLAAGFRAVEGTGADTELIDLHYIRLQLLARLSDVARLEEGAVALLSLAERAGTRQAVAAAHLARADVAFLRGNFVAARERGLRPTATSSRWSRSPRRRPRSPPATRSGRGRWPPRPWPPPRSCPAWASPSSGRRRWRSATWPARSTPSAGSAGSGRTRRGRPRAGAGSRGWRGWRSASRRRRWSACGAPRTGWTGSGCRSRRPGHGSTGPRSPRQDAPTTITSRRTGPTRPRRPTGAWPPSTGSAPARSPTGPAGCCAPWGSGRPRPPGPPRASCRSASCRWFAWSPPGSATPRSPGVCSSAPGP